MRDNTNETDIDLHSQLQEWGMKIDIPPTPNISAAIGRRIRTETSGSSDRRSRFGWWPLRPVLVAGVASVAIAAGVAVFFLSPSSSAPRISADTVLTRAAAVTPPANTLIRQTFRVEIRHGHRVQVSRINVWEGSVEGEYTVVDIQPHPVVSAARFMESSGGVVRTWASHDAANAAFIRDLAHTPAAGQDGRLLADRLLGTSDPSSWSAEIIGHRTFSGIRTILLRLSGPGHSDGSISLALAQRSYRLVGLFAPGYSARLVAVKIVAHHAAPQLVSSYLTANTKPNPSAVGAAY